MVVNYSYGKIYKITSESTGLVYYGSTTRRYLSQRLNKHLYDYKQYLKGNYDYVTSFELLKCEDYKIELIKDFPCANKPQLTTEEGKYIRENECVNKLVPGRTKKEWRKDNIEKIKEKKKNTEKIILKKLKKKIKNIMKIIKKRLMKGLKNIENKIKKKLKNT